MKKMEKRQLIYFVLALALMFNSCQEDQDYLNRVFRNYLGYEIEQATNRVAETTEGTEEGEYEVGSQSTLQNAINTSKTTFDNFNNTQEEVDDSYNSLISAESDYYNKMNPFTSVMLGWIKDSETLLNTTIEGTEEGNVAPGSKEPLIAAINEAEAFVQVGGYNQNELDTAVNTLVEALFTYESEIIGAYLVPIVNASFEEPGYETTDFLTIPGWEYQGKRKSWSNEKTGTVLEPTTTDGEYALRIGNYTHGIWQQLGESVHVGAKYSLVFDGSISNSPKDWKGVFYDSFILSRVIIFNGAIGDFSDITIVSEKSNNLGPDESNDVYVNFIHSFTVPQESPLLGKKMAVQFKTYEDGFSPVSGDWSSGTSEIWVESWVFVDNVILKRE